MHNFYPFPIGSCRAEPQKEQGRRNGKNIDGDNSIYLEVALCVEMVFTWTFPRNQDAKVKLKSELISIKF